MPSSDTLLELRETKATAVDALTTPERLTLEAAFDATIKALPAGGVEVRPGNIVGSVQVGARVIVVQPKLPVDWVLFMTAYAADPYAWRDTWSAVDGARDLVDGITALFVRACQHTLAQGLLRSYRQVEEDLPLVRGRIRWQRQARRPAPVPIATRYAVHDDDIAENRVLRAALARLRLLGTRDRPSGAALERVWRQVRHVEAARDPLALLGRVRWTRLNEHYRPLLELARVVLSGTMLEVQGGRVRSPGFTLRLFDVFESFVRTALQEASGLPPAAFATGKDVDISLDEAGRVRLIPDLAVRHRGRWCFVGDVKYKRDTGTGHNPDLYQLLAYASATELGDATLIYADGPADAPSHTVRHAGTRLHLRHLDLGQSPTSVLNELRRITSELVVPEPARGMAPPSTGVCGSERNHLCTAPPGSTGWRRSST